MHILIVAALVCAPSFAPASAGGALASVRQDPPADNREEVKAMIAELEAHAALRGKEDTEAVAVIDRLVQTFAECGPKDRAAIVKSLDKCFKEKRLEDENGVPDNKLYLAATTALGEMAPESVDVMMSWIGHKTHKKDVALQRLLILKLGKTKQEKA